MRTSSQVQALVNQVATEVVGSAVGLEETRHRLGKEGLWLFFRASPTASMLLAAIQGAVDGRRHGLPFRRQVAH